MPLTKEQVWAAADELEARQAKPTLVALRKALGNKGSYTDISEHMRERRRTQAENKAAFTEALPHAVEQRLSTLGQQVWASALLSANERLEAERQQFLHARAHMEAERDQALEVANHVTVELEEAQGRNDILERSGEELRTSNQQLLAKLAETNERLAAAVAQATESGRRVADLHRELDRLHQANAELVARFSVAPVLQRPGGHASRETSMPKKAGPTR